MNKKQKLELTWIGKDEQPVLEPRILIEDPTKSYGDPHSENMLIHGDNLLALKALEQKFAGKIKCIFIDPPYNTGSAFEHYDDGVEHSLWLSLIRDRLVILRKLLSKNGSLWITIDDNEAHYLKVVCDEVFGRDCFVSSLVWRSTDNSNNDAKQFSVDHNYVLVYSRGADWRPVPQEGDEAKRSHFKNPDNDPRGPWFDGNPLNSPKPRPNLTFDLVAPNGNVIKPPNNGWRWSRVTIQEKIAAGEIRFTPDGKGIRRRTYLADMKSLPPSSLWATLDDTGHNRQAKYELKNLFPELEVSSLFGTPKPERLLMRVLDLGTEPGDWVLDSFLGSGTTAAVAHKMGRKWIGIELGSHCDTHCLPRLWKVCDGTDQGGISEALEWKGGGGFKYYDLAPSLLKQDKHGNFVISEEYNADMMAAAMAKQEGFTYAPSQECYWKQGFSTEQDFIFTTTNHVTHAMLDLIAEEMAEGEHLLICCKKFSAGCDKRHLNIQVKKIPAMLMGRCEFGKEDYSLNIVNLTDEATAPAFVPQGPKAEPSGKGTARTHGNKNPNQMELF
jgi:adenine-specific DNA-methyltransferase